MAGRGGRWRGAVRPSVRSPPETESTPPAGQPAGASQGRPGVPPPFGLADDYDPALPATATAAPVTAAPEDGHVFR